MKGGTSEWQSYCEGVKAGAKGKDTELVLEGRSGRWVRVQLTFGSLVKANNRPQ